MRRSLSRRAAALGAAVFALACADDRARIITPGPTPHAQPASAAQLPGSPLDTADQLPAAQDDASVSARDPVRILPSDSGNECDPEPCSNAATLARYDFGHADISFELSLDGTAPTWSVSLNATGLPRARVDGQPLAEGAELDLNEVAISTSARFTRPDPDQGVFAPLCIEPGQSLAVIPQSNTGADAVPFLGLELEAPPGVLAGDAITLRLLAVDAPSPGGAHVLWKDGFPPGFGFSSCDGISEDDAFDLSIGHDHFNLGFAGPRGAWRARYQIDGTLVAGGDVSAEVDVFFLTE